MRDSVSSDLFPPYKHFCRLFTNFVTLWLKKKHLIVRTKDSSWFFVLSKCFWISNILFLETNVTRHFFANGRQILSNPLTNITTLSISCFLVTVWSTLTKDKIHFSKTSSSLVTRVVLGPIRHSTGSFPNDLYITVTLGTECIFAAVATGIPLPTYHPSAPYYNSF